MLYKTIILGLLESYPVLYQNLRLSRKLLAEIDRYANDLRSLHLSYGTEMALSQIEERIALEAELLNQPVQ